MKVPRLTLQVPQHVCQIFPEDHSLGSRCLASVCKEVLLLTKQKQIFGQRGFSAPTALLATSNGPSVFKHRQPTLNQLFEPLWLQVALNARLCNYRYWILLRSTDHDKRCVRRGRQLQFSLEPVDLFIKFLLIGCVSLVDL